MSSPSSRGFFAFHGPMAPGVRLMRTLSMSVKALLVVTAFMVPLGMLGWFYWANAGSQIEFAGQERRGVEWLQAWTPALRAAHEHRAMVARAGAGDATAASAATAAATAAADRWRAALGTLAEVDTHLGEALQTGTRVADLQRTMQAATAASTRAGEAHDLAIVALLSAGAAVGDSSNRVLDPDLDAFYLMQTSVIEGPGLVDALARTRDAGTALAVARNGALEAPLGAAAKLDVVVRALDDAARAMSGGERSADAWGSATAGL